MRVIDDTGQQLGIMPPQQALTIARQKGLDLVEIAATANPPVCRIMDFGRYQYQEQKRARQAKKHQKIIEVKEIKFRPKVDEHDYQFKKKHIERFLADGDKVKATIFFRGREMAHPEIGRRILERLIEDLTEVAIAETAPRQEGNQMHTILSARAGAKRTAPKAAAGIRRPRAAPAGDDEEYLDRVRDKAEATRDKGYQKSHAETQDTSGRGQALQEDRRPASSCAAAPSSGTSSRARPAPASASCAARGRRRRRSGEAAADDAELRSRSAVRDQRPRRSAECSYWI